MKTYFLSTVLIVSISSCTRMEYRKFNNINAEMQNTMKRNSILNDEYLKAIQEIQEFVKNFLK